MITRGTLCDYDCTVHASIVERVPIFGASADGMDVGDEERGIENECLHFYNKLCEKKRIKSMQVKLKSFKNLIII